jgi:hypothetical protein
MKRCEVNDELDIIRSGNEWGVFIGFNLSGNIRRMISCVGI